MPLPREHQAAIETVISSLYHLQSPPGPYGKRYYSLIFRDLPDRREYPDYYLFIKDPRSLNDISESLRQGRYKSPQGVAYDLFLIWSNAREYNEQGSQVYADADTLESYMRQVWQQYSPPLPHFDSLPRPGSLPGQAPAPPPAPAPEPERKVKRIKLTGASLGSSATKIRLGGPAPPAPAPPPPAAAPAAAPLPSIPPLTLKLGGRSAAPSASTSTSNATMNAPLPDLPNLPVPQAGPPPVPAPTQASPGRSRADRSVSAVPHKKDSKKKGKQVEGDGDADGDDDQGGTPQATFPDPESGWMGGDLGPDPNPRYLAILNKLRDYTDSAGRRLSLPLLDLPDRAARPDYYSLVSDPVAFTTIEAKITNRLYPAAQDFDRDLRHLFDTAKVFIRPDTPGTLYSDLITLQRLYQEITKRGAEPGDVSLTVGNGPGNVKREEGGENESKIGRPTTRPTLKDKLLLDSINFKGEVLRVGDWIYLSNSQNQGKPIIAQIWQTYKRTDSDQRCLSVCWYYRPEETVHPASRQFYENEVFKTGIFIDHVVEDFVGRCFVMFFTKYTRGRPRPPAWTPEMPLYVCEFRYKDDVKSFKKIKSWNSCVPEQVRSNEYEFEPYADEHVDILLKVQSPFIRGVTGPGGLDGTEVPPPAEPTNSQGGPPASTERATTDMASNSMDISVDGSGSGPATDIARMLESSSTNEVPTALPQQPNFTPSLDSTLANLDAASLLAPSPAYNQVSTPAASELATMDFQTPLPSSLRSKFRNDALGDLLWFSAPAATPPTVNKPTHSLAYLYWRVQKQNQAKSGRDEMST